MSPSSSANDDSQFQCRRAQTKVYAGPSKKPANTSPIPTLTEEDVYAAKVRKEFPEYVTRKSDSKTWRSIYEKRVQKKQKKQEEKLKLLTAKLGKAKSQLPTQARKTTMIDAVHVSRGIRKTMVHTPSAMHISKARKEVTNGSTKIHRISPPTTATRAPVQPKKPTALMSKCLKMAQNFRR